MAKKPVKKTEQYLVRDMSYGCWWDIPFNSTDEAMSAVDSEGDRGSEYIIYRIEQVATGTAANNFTWKPK